MIGHYLHDSDQTLLLCLACETISATRVEFAPVSALAPCQIKRIHGTRCDACGDVRLYQDRNDGSTDPEVREELDILARILTDACSEAASHERH